MQDAKFGDLGKGLAKVETLEKIYELLPLSQARANLSQLVDRVAYTGQPVLIAKHGTARAACVPLSMLSQSTAQFVAAAERSIEQYVESPAEDHDNDVDFEQVPGLGVAELKATRARIDAQSQAEDRLDEAMIQQVISHPRFAAEVQEIILRLASEQAMAKAQMPSPTGWMPVQTVTPAVAPTLKPMGAPMAPLRGYRQTQKG